MEDLTRRVETLETRANDHSNRLRILEQDAAGRAARMEAMEKGIDRAEKSASKAADGVDALKTWLLITAVGVLANLVILLFKGAMAQ